MELLTLERLARLLNVSEKTARRLAVNLPYVWTGKRKRYPMDGLERFLASGGMEHFAANSQAKSGR